MQDFKKYSIQKLVKKINRKGTALQKRAVKTCSELNLLAPPADIDELLLVGPVVLDLCSWGLKDIELVYVTDNAESLIKYLDSKYFNLPNYKHVIYDTGDTGITFNYNDWNFYLYITNTNKNLKKILFTRDYLIENLSPPDREKIVDMCLSGTPLGVSIRNSIKFRFGDDHALYRIANLQIDDLRYDTISPVFQFFIISGLLIEQYWSSELNRWITKKK